MKSDNFLILYEFYNNSFFSLPPYYEFVYTNNLGFRDSKNMNYSLNSTYSIILLGDSFTYGMGVSYEKTFSKLLENKLNIKSESYKTINLAIPGYNTVQELEILREYGVDLNPDIVIISYLISDILPSLDMEEFFLSEKAKLQRDLEINANFNLPFKCEIRSYFDYISNKLFITKKISEINKLSSTVNIFELISSYYSDDCAWGLIKNSFKQINTTSNNNNFTVIFMIVPPLLDNFNKDDVYSDIRKKIKEEALKNNFYVIDLANWLNSSNVSKIKLNDLDTAHLSEYGNKMISEILYNFIKNNFQIKNEV